MTKKDIVLKIAEQEKDLTQIEIKRIVQKTLDEIISSLEKGQTVELRNFGVFKVKSRRVGWEGTLEQARKFLYPQRKLQFLSLV